MGFQIYMASSWKNAPIVNRLAELFRAQELQVYSFAEMFEGQHHFNWPDVLDVKEHDGITALECEDSRKAYNCDKYFLEWANCCVLLNPAGRDAHLEAGYIKGKGGRLYIIGEFPRGEFSIMYNLADGLYRINELARLIRELRRLDPSVEGKVPAGENVR
jgi:hypothetical protein